jgi:hypothetical protein
MGIFDRAKKAVGVSYQATDEDSHQTSNSLNRVIQRK